MERQAINSEKIYMLHIFDKGLYPEYIKHSYKSVIQRYITQFKMGITLRYFTKRDITMANKSMSKCSKSFRKCKIKPQHNTMLYP